MTTRSASDALEENHSAKRLVWQSNLEFIVDQTSILDFLPDSGCLAQINKFMYSRVPNVFPTVFSWASYEFLRSIGVPKLLICEKLATAGNLASIIDARKDGCRFDYRTTCNAAKAGQVSVFKYCRKRNCPWIVRRHIAVEQIATSGNLDMVNYAIKYEGMKMNEIALEAIKFGHLNIARQATRSPQFEHLICSHAAMGGQWKILETLIDEGWTWGAFVIQKAIEQRYLPLLHLTKGKNISDEEKLCDAALATGQLDILKIFRSHGRPLSALATKHAIRGGNMDCIEYLFNEGVQFSEADYFYAISIGRLDIVKFLHRIEVPWSTFITHWAVSQVHLDILKYLCENGCPVNTEACLRTCPAWNRDIIAYLVDNTFPNEVWPTL